MALNDQEQAALEARLASITAERDGLAAQVTGHQQRAERLRQSLVTVHQDRTYEGALYPDVMTAAPALVIGEDGTVTADSLQQSRQWREQHPALFRPPASAPAPTASPGGLPSQPAPAGPAPGAPVPGFPLAAPPGLPAPASLPPGSAPLAVPPTSLQVPGLPAGALAGRPSTPVLDASGGRVTIGYWERLQKEDPGLWRQRSTQEAYIAWSEAEAKTGGGGPP
jgi:hypothetical protein